MKSLREKIATIIDPMNYMEDGEARLSFERADAILAIPELKEALHIHAVLDEQIAAELLEARNPNA